MWIGQGGIKEEVETRTYDRRKRGESNDLQRGIYVDRPREYTYGQANGVYLRIGVQRGVT